MSGGNGEKLSSTISEANKQSNEILWFLFFYWNINYNQWNNEWFIECLKRISMVKPRCGQSIINIVGFQGRNPSNNKCQTNCIVHWFENGNSRNQRFHFEENAVELHSIEWGSREYQNCIDNSSVVSCAGGANGAQLMSGTIRGTSTDRKKGFWRAFRYIFHVTSDCWFVLCVGWGSDGEDSVDDLWIEWEKITNTNFPNAYVSSYCAFWRMIPSLMTE